MINHIEISIELKCNDCGEGVEGEEIMGIIYIDPCQKCIDEATETGKEAGKDEAYEEVHNG
jgi:hypothetical protein